MRRLEFVAPRRLEFREVTEPRIESDDQVIVRPIHLPVCALRIWRGYEGICESWRRWFDEWDEYGFEVMRVEGHGEIARYQEFYDEQQARVAVG